MENVVDSLAFLLITDLRKSIFNRYLEDDYKLIYILYRCKSMVLKCRNKI
jgi:hypothetical protein